MLLYVWTKKYSFGEHLSKTWEWKTAMLYLATVGKEVI